MSEEYIAKPSPGWMRFGTPWNFPLEERGWAEIGMYEPGTGALRMNPGAERMWAHAYEHFMAGLDHLGEVGPYGSRRKKMATINGKSTKPMPASVTAAMKKGYPKATAQAMGGRRPTTPGLK